MWSPGCICCSPDTVQQESTKKVLQSTPCRQGIIKYVTCIKRSLKVCVHCLDSLTKTMLASSKCMVKRWGILRKAIPRCVKKTIALVNCLAKLHNFCINEVDSVDDA